MKRTLMVVAAVTLLPNVASAWIAQNGLKVEPRGDGFHVPYRGLSGAREFWCAAGDYVLRELGLSPDTLIFRTSSPPRRAGDGISFSLSRDGAKKPGIILFSGRRGVTAAHARELCSVAEIES